MHKPEAQPAIEAATQPLMLESAEGRDRRLALDAKGKQLVPLTYDRAVFNALRTRIFGGPELPHHNSLLTAEQARRINEHFDIELDFGTHGFGRPTIPAGMHPYEALPTDLEYNEAERAVSDLEEGDILFLEGQGFAEHPMKPITQKEIVELDAMVDQQLKDIRAESLDDFMLKLAGVGMGRVLVSMATFMKNMMSAHDTLQAQAVRQGEMGSAWMYARFLASAKGIQVRYADYDVFQSLKTEQYMGQDLLSLAASGDIDNQLRFLRTARLRELTARNALKDWALANLPSEDAPLPVGRKPKLRLLFGGAHRDTMVAAFKDMGLDVKVRTLKSHNATERITENMLRDMRKVFEAMVTVASTIGDPVHTLDQETQHPAEQLATRYHELGKNALTKEARRRGGSRPFVDRSKFKHGRRGLTDLTAPHETSAGKH